MKKLLPILLFLLSIQTNATTYYFSASGNDANSGTSTGSPWKTLNKFNTTTFAAGDNIYFNRGDSFYGAMVISQSGSSGLPITIGAYGTGANPIITGFATVSSWTNLGSNIWESSSAVSTLSTCNMVVINGVNTAMGRYPNSGYLSYQSHSTNTSITSSSINSAVTNWSGAELVFRTSRWLLERKPIASSSGATLNYSGGGSTPQFNNLGFFIQNDARTLDVQNEWYYNPSTHKIRIYSTTSPTNVQVSSIDELVLNSSANYITYSNIDFTGANTNLFENRNSHDITIQNCNFSFAGQKAMYINNAVSFGGETMTINGNTFSDNNENAMSFLTFTSNCLIENNTINNTGIIAGAGTSSENSCDAIDVYGAGSTIKNNTITNTGHIGIALRNKDNFTAKNNFVKDFGLVRYDVGGIYSWNADSTSVTSRLIDSNIIINTPVATQGINTLDPTIVGIYLDGNSKNTTITNNSVSGCTSEGIHILASSFVTIRNNTCFNNGNLITYDQPNGASLGLWHFSGMSTVNNLSIKDNIFFSKNSNQFCLYYRNDDGTFNFGTADSNYYARPISDNLTFRTAISFTNTDRNLAMWQTYTGQDLNSNKSPVTISNVNQLFYAYNPNSYDSTITIPAGNWIDVTGTPYNTGSLILSPYTSVVLISTGTNIPPIANAGTNVNITLPTNSFTQIGSGTDADGSIVAYNWTQISGANTATIGSPNSATTLISNLIAGSYVFQFKVTDNGGATGTDTMSVVVNSSAPPNLPPVVNAGGNKIITLPVSTITQSGSATDPDGTIAGYLWTQVGNTPIVATIVSPTSATTVINNLGVSGVYTFKLTATDNLGATGSQNITVTVNAPIGVAPTAHAGVDQSITWPTNSVTLSGSATAGTGTITSYNWNRISGTTSSITNSNSATTTVTGLSVGVYLFELTVTDNSGLQGKDTMQVTVNKGTASLSYSTPSLNQTWDGSPKYAGVITSPAGLSTSTLYNNVGAAPTEPNSYSLNSAITDPNWISTPITGTLTINKATATFNITGTSVYFNNNAQVPFVSTNPANLTGVNIASPHTSVGIYSDTITLNNAHYQATQVITPFTITAAGANIVITSYQNKFYTGSPISVIAVTNPSGLTNDITYNASSTPPTNAGSYTVIATINDGMHTGADTVTMVIQKATPTLSWNPIANISDQTPISGTQLNATSNVAGYFTYSYNIGQVLAAGVYNITATFHPTDSANYNAVSITNTLIVSGSPILNWFIKHGKFYPVNLPNQ